MEECGKEEDEELDITNHLIACVNHLFREKGHTKYNLLDNLDANFKKKMEQLNDHISNRVIVKIKNHQLKHWKFLIKNQK